MQPRVRPHVATYRFLDAAGRDAGEEAMELQPRSGGWLVTSHLALTGPDRLTAEVEWHLEPDLSTHVLYMSSVDQWGEEHELEAAVTGNGLIASRRGPSGPTQVEMGWGPEVQLDHLAACFTTVLVGRLALQPGTTRRVTSVYIGAEDLLVEPMEQEYRRLDAGGETLELERVVPSTADRARIRALVGGVVLEYAGLFRVLDGWRYTDPAPAPTK